ncbi:MAG TPA: O-antigen ligase family protein [Aestuariivirga sp.]|nr:O-antigen ligase family protein [Aestuariivirga sp.]
MPENIRALIFALALVALAFACLRTSVTALVGRERARTWLIIWVTVTASLFLTQNFWLFLLVTGFILLLAIVFERDRIVLYTLVLCASPVVTVAVPGFGGIGSFAHISPQDFFAVLLLLPALLVQRNANISKIHGRWPLVFLVLYYILIVALYARGSSATETMRAAVGYFLAMVFPFLAFSTCVDSADGMKDTVTAFIFTLFLLAFEGAFEVVKSWQLYSSVVAQWNTYGEGFGYIERDGLLRASGPTGGPIILGFLFMTGIGLCLGLPERLLPSKLRLLLIAVLVGGIATPFARGPWVGAFVILLVFQLTGRNPFGSLFKSIIIAAACILLLSQLPFGEKIIDMLPYVGSEGNTETADYRVKLLDNALTVIARNPVFGSVDFLETPEMQEMIQGQGIIDIVNSYLQISLRYGFVGLSLFVLFFSATLLGLARALMSLPESETELKVMARALFATLCGVLITIFTVSSVGQIPYIYWILAGLCVAQTRIIRASNEALQAAPAPDKPLVRLHPRPLRINPQRHPSSRRNPRG